MAKRKKGAFTSWFEGPPYHKRQKKVVRSGEISIITTKGQKKKRKKRKKRKRNRKSEISCVKGISTNNFR